MENDAEPEVLFKLSQEERDKLYKFLNDYIRDYIQESGMLNRLALESARTEGVNEALRAVTAKTGATPEDALATALTLYEVVIDAIKQDQRLVLVDKDYRFVREITGLMPKKPESSPHEKVAG
jgi:hypothetical protein